MPLSNEAIEEKFSLIASAIGLDLQTAEEKAAAEKAEADAEKAAEKAAAKEAKEAAA